MNVPELIVLAFALSVAGVVLRWAGRALRFLLFLLVLGAYGMAGLDSDSSPIHPGPFHVSTQGLSHGPGPCSGTGCIGTDCISSPQDIPIIRIEY